MHRAGNGTWRTGAQEDRTWAALQLPGVGPWAARASINTLQDPITNFFAEQLNPTIAGNRNAGGTDEQVERIGAALGGIRGGLRGRSIPSIQVELERHITDAKTSRRMSAAIDIVNRGIREHMIELGMDPDGDDEQMVAAMAWNMIHAEVVTIVDNNPNRRAAETQAAQLIQTRGQALVQRAQQVVDTHTLLGLFDTTTQLTEQVGDQMRERGADMTLVWAVTGNVVCTLADAYERGGRESARLDVHAVIDEAIDGVIELPE
jgi:hypothetical protein